MIVPFDSQCSYPDAVIAFNGSGAMQPPQGLGCVCNQGMGALTMDGTGLLGTGLFATATDLSTWGAGEYITLALAGYTLYALTSTTKQTYRTASKRLRRARA